MQDESRGPTDTPLTEPIATPPASGARRGLRPRKPCEGSCAIHRPGCTDECTGHRMVRKAGQVGYALEKAQAEKAWKERRAAEAGSAKPKRVRLNRDNTTGHFVPGEVKGEAAPEVAALSGKSPLEVLKTYFPHLYYEESRQAWHVFLKAAFGEPLDAGELALYTQCTGRTKEFVQAVRELWLICGRRAGKSEIVAFLAVFLSCFRTYKRSKGEKILGMVLAADREQAGVIMNYISEMLHSNKRLEAMIKRRGSQFRETQQSIMLTNGITIRVNTSNYRRVRGYTIAFVLCDEIAFWESEDAANPDHEVLKALRPALGTTRGMLICLTSPYAQRGEAYKTFVKHHGKDESKVLVWKAATRVMNPTFPQEDIDAAYEDDAAAAGAEYGAEFRTDVQALFDPAVVTACAAPDAEIPPKDGVIYRGFTDPAGGSGQDSMTLAIAHTLTITTEKGSETTEVLDFVKEIKPPFNPDDVTKEFAEDLKRYRLNAVTGDRYAGEWPRERFRAHGIEYAISEKTKGEIYKTLLPLVNGRRAALLNNKRLLSQLQTLERKTARGGKDSIDHPPGGHDDVGNAAAGALTVGSSAAQYRVRCAA